MFLRSIALSAFLISIGLSAVADTSFTASHLYSMTGKLGTDNRYGDTDHGHFEAGDTITLVGTNWTRQTTVTCKGIAIFDLEADGMEAALAKSKGKKLMFSFVLDEIKGRPRPLRVEYIGTTGEIDTDRSLTAQFERQPIHQANRVLDKNATPGIKVIDASSLIDRDFKNRYMIIRFEQEGMKRQITSNDGQVDPDLYIFRNDSSTVKLTITDQKDTSAVSSGYANILPDMPTDLTSDMSPNPIQDMPADPIQDMPKNPIQDMPKDPIQDMSDNLITD